ncbi:uncharacterized protein LOC125947509 [Dermacentor silvarum]|uniref:uncharacterized protein LOC125947509 n=1 Tax=Dermacentor silvarum TaxID=543639 RepID=UPI00210112E2|nr:uncharacterized protein LOC125947509 [Dermacentor silvarum]
MAAAEAAVPTCSKSQCTKRPRHTQRPSAVEATAEAEATVVDTAAAEEEVHRFTASRLSRSPKEAAAAAAADSEAAMAAVEAEEATEDTAADGNKRVSQTHTVIQPTTALAAEKLERLPPAKQAGPCIESTPAMVQRKNVLTPSNELRRKAQEQCSPGLCNILLTSRARGFPRDFTALSSPPLLIKYIAAQSGPAALTAAARGVTTTQRARGDAEDLDYSVIVPGAAGSPPGFGSKASQWLLHACASFRVGLRLTEWTSCGSVQ